MRDNQGAETRTTGPSIMDVASLLLRLGRPGAHLSGRPGDGGGILRQARPVRNSGLGVNAPVLQAARAAGYLMPAAQVAGAACEVLSPAGREALRVLLMAPAKAGGDHQASRPVPGPSGGHQRRSQRLARSARPGQEGERRVERMTLVEQLAARKDARGRPLLNETQVAAALRLAQDFAIGHLQPRVTSRWTAEATTAPRRRGAPGAGIELGEAAAAAQARARRALAVLGGYLANIAVDVCCFERGLEAIAAQHHWPSGTARIVLGIALDELATHYGMIVPARRSGGVMQHWGDNNFRPSAEAGTSNA